MDSVAVDEPTAEEKIKQMEHELHCSICQEYFVKAFTLNCSHSFCYSCINDWKQNHVDCPLCRCVITGMAPSRALDNLVATLNNDASLSRPIVPMEIMDFSSLFGYDLDGPIQSPVESYYVSDSQEQSDHLNINENSDGSVSSIPEVQFTGEIDISSDSIDDDFWQEFSHSASTQDELTDVEEEEEEEMYSLESTDDWTVERAEYVDGVDNGDDNSDDSSDDNSDDSSDDNGDDNGDDNSDDNGDDNSDDNGDYNGDDNSDDNGDDNTDDNSDYNEEQYSQQSYIKNRYIVTYFGASDETSSHEQFFGPSFSECKDIQEGIDTYFAGIVTDDIQEGIDYFFAGI